jgi:hypothetical protein
MRAYNFAAVFVLTHSNAPKKHQPGRQELRSSLDYIFAIYVNYHIICRRNWLSAISVMLSRVQEEVFFRLTNFAKSSWLMYTWSAGQTHQNQLLELLANTSRCENNRLHAIALTTQAQAGPKRYPPSKLPPIWYEVCNQTWCIHLNVIGFFNEPANLWSVNPERCCSYHNPNLRPDDHDDGRYYTMNKILFWQGTESHICWYPNLDHATTYTAF